MQQGASGYAIQTDASSSSAAAGLVERVLEQQRQMMKEQRDYMDAKLEAKDKEMAERLEQQRAELTRPPPAPEAVVADGQLAALQARLQGLHVAKLLSDEVRAYATTESYAFTS